jgi:hypothetical protein
MPLLAAVRPEAITASRLHQAVEPFYPKVEGPVANRSDWRMLDVYVALTRQMKTAIADSTRTLRSPLPCSLLPIWRWPEGVLRAPNPAVSPEYRRTRSIAVNRPKNGLARLAGRTFGRQPRKKSKLTGTSLKEHYG